MHPVIQLIVLSVKTIISEQPKVPLNDQPTTLARAPQIHIHGEPAHDDVVF